jgi:biotin carboxyl carrier protein
MKMQALLGDAVHDITIAREDGIFHVTVDGKKHEVDARRLDGHFYTMIMDGKSYEVSVECDGETCTVRHGAAEQRLEFADPGRVGGVLGKKPDGPASIDAVMPGKVVRLLVAEGDEVEEGQGLLVLEAMKMENEVCAPKAGTVCGLAVEAGVAVESGQRLCVIE